MVTLGTARWLAPLSFAIDFAAQVYGMSTAPNMKTISDRNVAAFSPQPMMIALFFFPQQLAQLWWLRKIWSKDVNQDQLDYVPFYALGNTCIATWMLFWNNEQLGASNIFVAINTISQLYYAAVHLPPMNADNMLTHFINKTFAGIGVLDLLHNTSAAHFRGVIPPSLAVEVLTGLGFGIGSLLSDGILGACLVYDLFALYLGQDGSWKSLLGLYTIGTAVLVAIKSTFMYNE